MNAKFNQGKKPKAKKFKKISTQVLTVLIICVILHIEQRKGENKRRKKIFPVSIPSSPVPERDLLKEKER